MSGLNKPKLPKCADCGKGQPRVVNNGGGGHVWLCASCEVLRANPDAVRMPSMPSARRPRALQREVLFGVSEIPAMRDTSE